MSLSEDELRNLLNAPRETLQVELKQWIDPASPEGSAKIAKGCMALRNNNGGFLVIGFDDDGNPDIANAPGDVETDFHTDVVQGIVTQYSSEPFPIEVQFGEKDGHLYPVIAVPSGVRTPVAAKRDLPFSGRMLIKHNAVYVRSLSSNNTVSSSEPRRGDWERLVQVCFDNREADIGTFVRRHLSGVNLEALGNLLLGARFPLRPSAVERAREMVNSGRNRFIAAMQERGIKQPPFGLREAAVVIDGEVPQHAPTQSFLQRLFVAQPNHTGWPAWLDSRQFGREDQPRVYNGAWEALLVDLGSIRSGLYYLNYWSIDTKGVFYLLDAVEDDVPGSGSGAQLGTGLDYRFQIARVTEIISTALSFARSMGCDPAKTSLVFAFRWSKLKNRHLASWSDPRRRLISRLFRGAAHQDNVTADLTVPLDLPQSAIAPHVEGVVRHLFALFDGTEIDSDVISEIVEDSLKIRF